MTQPTQAPDVAEVLKRNYGVLYRHAAGRLALIALLIVASYGLHALGTPDPVLVPFFVVAAFVFLFAVIRLSNGLRMGVSKRVLNTYPLEYHTRVDKKSSQWLLLGDVHTVKVSVRGRHGAPRMRAVNASAVRRWPKGAETGGAWVAGDLAFGAVMVVPGTLDLLFMQPENWDKFAAERAQADPERLARAERSGITKRLEREPKVSYGT
ncbi:hypothetical protein [Streptomyces sp. Da 82-17]|uniref:hypothetical protein n=1 Tax=Streptomyces sp. Da 82-17 TaxID=3377116 RepID=UPI0038D3C23E